MGDVRGLDHARDLELATRADARRRRPAAARAWGSGPRWSRPATSRCPSSAVQSPPSCRGSHGRLCALGKLIARAINHLGLPAVHDASLTTRPGAEQFDRRFEQHRPELTAYSYRMLGSPFEAEDAVQETFIRAWRAADRFEGRSTLRSWL